MSEQALSTATVTADAGRRSLGDLIEAAGTLSSSGEIEAARRLYKSWIAANQSNPLLHVALFNCSALDTQSGDTAEAIASLRKAIEANADFMPAYINLGGLLERGGAADKAIELWRKVVNTPVAVTGNSVNCVTTALKQIARVFSDRQMTEAAESATQLCLDINPQQQDIVEQYIAMRLAQCKWPVVVPRETLGRKAQVKGIHPLSMAVYTDDPLLQLASSDRYMRLSPYAGPQSMESDRRHAAIDLAGRRLRIGYISSDLRDHAIGYLMAEFFELHKGNDVEVFAYYCGPESTSALTNRIKSAVEHWVDIRPLNDDEAARRIAADGIDILVDINGHTRDARTGVFARHPAPVQVNWLGFPGTMGTPYHHYIIADDWIIPPASELYYSEKVVRLPCYQPNDRKRVVAAERPTRRDAGLPDNAFVFCCFNGTHKISRFTFERWLEILQRVPDSVLWLLDTSNETKERLGQYAASRGVSADRLVYAPKQANPQHLARYVLADLFLDTAPYGAHTTASDALWAGVPVLTLSGRSFASRVCGSLVRSAGLEGLVVSRVRDYVERAVALGRNRAEIVAYKQQLEAGRSSCRLFDTQLLVERIEDLYRSMAREHALGRTPRPSLVNLESYLEVGVDHDHEDNEMLAVENYHELYKSGLSRQHLARPMPPDGRMWTAQDIALLEAPPAGQGAVATAAAAAQVAPVAANSQNMTEQVLRRLRSQGYTPRTMLDVGAHVGSFTQSFLAIFPDCVPTLVEPNPFCQNELSRLGLEQHGVAAADRNGSATLYLTREWLQSTGVSLYRENTHFFRDEVVVRREVETRRIDDLFAGRRFDFVKIDTQGSELDVLRGGANVLRNADYVLVEVSLVDYNAGGARAEELFQQLRDMGFVCGDVVEFHRLAGVANGDLLQMDFLFQRRAAGQASAGGPSAPVLALARSLQAEGRGSDARALLEYLCAVEPGNTETLQPLVGLLAAEGRMLEALGRLCDLKAASTDMSALVGVVQQQMPAALKGYNDHLAAGEIAEAEKYLGALITLIPHNAALLDAALSCNLALGRTAKAREYAATLLMLDPAHAGAQAAIAGTAPKEIALVPPADVVVTAQPAIHPLVQLRDLHDQISAILCEPLTQERAREVERLLAESRAIRVDAPAGTDMEAWEKHYRLMLSAIDMSAVQSETQRPGRDAPIKLVTSAGAPTNWLEMRAAAARLGAKAVFFAAADEAYVDLYGSTYVKSILAHCDVPCLVVVHVIGGAGRLAAIGKSLGITDRRLFLAGDRFAAEGVTTECHDAPPKGKSAKPLAHLQSTRFLRLGSLLQKLKLPVFVSDIDLLLQRGVADLLERSAEADLVLNQNDGNRHAGSRITANLLLVNPTQNADQFGAFLRSYLEKQLGQPSVTRWIDQVALLLGRHHLMLHGTTPRIERFDTSQDINNVMYQTYQDNPFRFLSLYHGFDMSSLPQAGEKAEAAPKRRKSTRASPRGAAG